MVIANYLAVFHDFGHVFDAEFAEAYKAYLCANCRKSGNVCLNSVDQWLVDSTAVISAQQASQELVNSPIKRGQAVRYGYRPPAYGRALVIPATHPTTGKQVGLFDVKGCGVAPGVIPTNDGQHRNGLEYLGVALGDFFYGWLVDEVFARTVPGFSTVPVYAILDLGFDVVNGWIGTAPAGLHIRRAHARERGGLVAPLSGSEEELVVLQIELLLRTYGLTSASAPFTVVRTKDGEELHAASGRLMPSQNKEQVKAQYIINIARNSQLELFNIQLANQTSWSPPQAQVVDFGHFHARKSFKSPAASRARDGIFNVGRIIKPGDAAFVQPDARVAIDTELCRRDAVNAFGFYAALSFRSGRFTSSTVEYVLRRGIVRAFGKH